MQNNGTIPNVSTVFRQLIKISTTNPRFNNQSSSNQLRSTNNNFTYGSNGLNQLNGAGNERSFPSSILDNDRQQRHDALMGRLKSSFQENRQLLGIQESPLQRMSGNVYNMNERQQTQNTSPFGTNNQFTSNDFTSYHKSESFRPNETKKWAPPRIKYRHIEDLQQKSTLSINNTVSGNTEGNSKKNIQNLQKNSNQLKNEFYQNFGGLMDYSREKDYKKSKDNNMQRRQNHQGEQVNENQLQQYHQEDHEEDNINKFSILSQKPSSKYSENLESYYDICRKPVKSSVLTGKESRNQESRTNTQKFMRKQVPKVEGIYLEKAMKILSLDD